MKTVIVGGVAGGMAAAARLRPWVQGVVGCLVDRPVPLGGGITAVPVASVRSS